VRVLLGLFPDSFRVPFSSVYRAEQLRKLIAMTFGQQPGFRPVEPDDVLSVERYPPEIRVFGRMNNVKGHCHEPLPGSDAEETAYPHSSPRADSPIARRPVRV
jgi:hypothetical protein